MTGRATTMTCRSTQLSSLTLRGSKCSMMRSKWSHVNAFLRSGTRTLWETKAWSPNSRSVSQWEDGNDLYSLYAGGFQPKLVTRIPWRKYASIVQASSTGEETYSGSLVGTGMKFGIVVARFNDLVTKLLLEGALEDFQRHGVPRSDIDVAWVPGSFELPVVSKAMAKSGKYDAVVAIGVVVRGATAHYDAVVSGATSGVLNASSDSGVPVIFGVLTCDTMEQALDRAGGKVGNKGGEAAVTAIETASLLKLLRAEGKAAERW